MTFLQHQLDHHHQELTYHQEQIAAIEAQIDRVRVAQEFGEQATSTVEDAIANINSEHLELFKEHLLSLFEGCQSTRAEVKEEAPQEIVEEEDTPKTRAKLLGIPDFSPDTYEDLAPNVSFSSSGRAYVGFNDRKEAERFRNAISEPSLIDDAVIMNGFKYEVKFHSGREYVQEIADSVNSMSDDLNDDWTPAQLKELDWQEQLVRTADDIFYDPSTSKCFIGFSAKGRADQYGSYLTRILNIAEKYIVSNKPSVTTNTKYELVLEQIDLDSAQHLSKFNLKKEYDDSKNKEARELWRTTRQRKHEPACKPLPKLVPLDEVKLGDIVYLNSINNQYKVLNKVELDGTPHIEVICVFNSERPSLVSAISYLKECYLVPVDSIQIDPQFKEEVLTEDVNIYIPEEESTVKKSEALSEDNFPAAPYNSIKLTELEPADIITSTPYAKSAYEVIAVNKEYATAICLYHQALPGRVGEEYTFSNPYLVEKSSSHSSATKVLVAV